MRHRRKAREFVLTVLYQYEVGTSETVSGSFKKHLSFYPLKENILDFAETLARGVEKNWDFLNGKITQYAKGWQLERIVILDRNILRMALYEMFFIEDIPIIVSINEAIELAKMFCDDKSRIFINGILDKVYKKELNDNGKGTVHNHRKKIKSS